MSKSRGWRIVAFEVHGDCTVVPRAQPEKRRFCEQMDPTKSCPESSMSAYVKGKPSELKAPAAEGGARVRSGCEEVSAEGVAQKVGQCFVENLKSRRTRRTSAENAEIPGRTQPFFQAQRPRLSRSISDALRLGWSRKRPRKSTAAVQTRRLPLRKALIGLELCPPRVRSVDAVQSGPQKTGEVHRVLEPIFATGFQHIVSASATVS